MPRFVVRPEAEADIEATFRWYEAQSPGLGSEFVRAVDACLAGIERNPELYAEHYRRARRALLRRFPYAIFYVILTDSIDVIACFHVRRDPRHWQAQLRR